MARPASSTKAQHAEYRRALAVGGQAHATGGMDCPTHQALDAYALCTTAATVEEVCGGYHTQDDAGPIWEGIARAS
ncbi:hypothetical protein KUTG_09984 [Kutzneria sp. 744]|nr:hypothetical protein KUTG_09984 [Kutzneria sp. 744]